jgi:UDP-N-acetylmuramyl pentapeptide synthase
MVLGAMLELGGESATAHRRLGEIISEFASRVSLEALVLVGDAFAEVREAFPSHVFFERNLDEDATRDIASHVAFKGRVVLVKGSRSFRLERVVELLRAESEVPRLRRTMSE